MKNFLKSFFVLFFGFAFLCPQKGQGANTSVKSSYLVITKSWNTTNGLYNSNHYLAINIGTTKANLVSVGKFKSVSFPRKNGFEGASNAVKNNASNEFFTLDPRLTGFFQKSRRAQVAAILQALCNSPAFKKISPTDTTADLVSSINWDDKDKDGLSKETIDALTPLLAM
jgi:hypothetical protein